MGVWCIAAVACEANVLHVIRINSGTLSVSSHSKRSLDAGSHTQFVQIVWLVEGE